MFFKIEIYGLFQEQLGQYRLPINRSESAIGVDEYAVVADNGFRSSRIAEINKSIWMKYIYH